MSEAKYQPVFIIGAARSGTKLVRDLIACHPQVDKIPYDINYVWRYGNENISHDEISPDMITTENMARIKEYFDSYSSGATVLIEKTVSNCLRVPAVQKVFPNAKFILLVRDGRDVVESSFRQWTAPPDWKYIIKKTMSFPLAKAYKYASAYGFNILRKMFTHGNGVPSTWGPRYKGIDEDLRKKTLIEVCAIQWCRCVEVSVVDLSKPAKSDVFLLRYEDFVTDTLSCLKRIASFLDLGSDFYCNNSKITAVSGDNIGKGMRLLETEQKQLVEGYINNTSWFLEAHCEVVKLGDKIYQP